MSAAEVPGLAEFCRAIRDYEGVALNEAKKEFVSRNWSMVVALDQLAAAEFGAGNFDASLAKLKTLTELLPNNNALFLRRCRAEVRKNVPGALEGLLNFSGRIGSDYELFESIDIVLAEGRQDLANRIIEQCSKLEKFSTGIMAASKAKVLASVGRLSDALKVLSAGMDPASPRLLLERLKYRLLEQLLRFDESLLASRDVALRWGEEHDLQFVVQHLLLIFDFGAATSILGEFVNLHPVASASVQVLQGEVTEFQRAAQAATAEHGSTKGADRDNIFSALSDGGTSASRILWGKQALVQLLRSGSLTESDYVRFAWFLPNWEQSVVRHRILAAAASCCQGSLAVKRGWLHYLITQRAYGDGAQFCETLLNDTVDVDIRFFVIALLRLQQLAIVPAFMPVETFEKLRAWVLKDAEKIDAGFRFVMQEHLVELGWPRPTWSVDQIPSHEFTEARGFRRLFAVTTGRLSRRGTKSRSEKSTLRKAKPVLAISGQLRGFKDAWPSINRHLRRSTGAPIVISVWDKSVNATGRHAGRLERALPADIIARLKPEERFTDTFMIKYPNTSKLLFGVTDVDAEQLIKFIDEPGCEILEVETESEDILGHILSPHLSPNMLKMYYKFARLESLIREAEWQSGEMFSHVIWIRPDCEIIQLSPTDLDLCLTKRDVAWSSFVTETSFGDYAMVLPRPAFRVLGTIFARVCLAGDSRLLPWRPNRSVGLNPASSLDAFGGPDVIFDMLLAEGYMPLAGIPRMSVKLRGGTIDPDSIRETFLMESRQIQ